jgi:transcriptional regulator with XRE-family HTH domain
MKGPAGPGLMSPYRRLLGDELRRRRKARGWTRKDLRTAYIATFDDDLSLQTLATYELGTRNVVVERLDRLARTLGTFAGAVLTDVDRRMFGTSDTFSIDLRLLAESARSELAPAAKWAAVYCESLTVPVTELSGDALTRLAELCDLDFATLAEALRECKPASK